MNFLIDWNEEKPDENVYKRFMTLIIMNKFNINNIEIKVSETYDNLLNIDNQ